MALAEALQTVSHDRLTRMLQAHWSGQTLLELAVRTLFVWERGYLILDDTVIPKPFATAIEGLAWVYSSQERKLVYGLSPRPPDLDQWDCAHPPGDAPMAQRGPIKGCTGPGVTQRGP